MRDGSVRRNTTVRTENEVDVVLKGVICSEYKMDPTGEGEVLVGSIEQTEVICHMMTAESELALLLDTDEQVLFKTLTRFVQAPNYFTRSSKT